jgi:ATP-dependent helicase/nuclease subunit B
MNSFYHHVAQQLLDRHAPPDLRGAMVLLPNYHVAQPLAQAISQVSGLPALLLPQMTTLADWAQTIQLDDAIISDTQRTATLYHALQERNWFPDANLWSLARELLALIDELTRHHVTLPATTEQFTQQLTLAYQARSGQAMQFEARVVHELWYAMTAGDELDATRAYQMRLGILAQQVEKPLYILQTCDLAAPELHFLQACRQKIEVTLFDPRAWVKFEPELALLNLAFGEQDTDLRSMANLLAPEAALRIEIFGAHGMEQEAQAADVQIRRWLLAGHQSIAVVVQDRLVARRLRARLERAEVLVQDETGWTFATLSVSTVLMRWLEALQGDFYYLDVLDLLKSSFMFADNQELRRTAAFQFEQLVRHKGVIAHLPDFLAMTESPELSQSLLRLQQAARMLSFKSATLAGWLLALHKSLDVLGIIPSWQQDTAGQQLMQLLALWQEELKTDTANCSFTEWRRWLSQQLDLNTYRDLSIVSPVIFTHLAATRWRIFDAVLIIGCDATHLPAPVQSGQWFNDAVRATLGLPLSFTQQAQVRDDLLALLILNNLVMVTWQASQNGEFNLLSPYFEMLRALHQLAFNDDLMNTDLGELIKYANVSTKNKAAIAGQSTMPRPAIPENLLPERISVSGYNSLVACPYQYFARHILHLNELDEVRETLDKRDYGTWVHQVLQRFHGEIPHITGLNRENLEQVLQRISNEVFKLALAHDYLAQAWLIRWQALIPAYLDWQLNNEQAGWRYRESEKPFEICVAEKLTLRGRLDRIDEYSDDPKMTQVFDYKTQSASALKNKLRNAGEDVQLACYIQAISAELAAFVSLEDDLVQDVLPPDDIVTLAKLNFTRLQTVFKQMQDGIPLSAHGAENICSYCEMKGLCRHGEWDE